MPVFYGLFFPGTIVTLIAITVYDGVLIFTAAKWLGFLFLAMLALFHLSWRTQGRQRIELDVLDGCLWAFAGYAALSLLWSPDPLSGIPYLSKFFLAAILFIHLKNTLTTSLAHLLTLAVISAGIIVLVCEWYAYPIPYGLFGNENLVTEFSLLTLPFCLLPFLDKTFPGGRLSRIIAGLVFLATIHYFIRSPSKIELFVGLGLLLFGLARWLIQSGLPVPRKTVIASVVLAGLIALIAMGWKTQGLSRSTMLRLTLYTNTAALWLDRPVTGHGAAAFQALYPLYKEAYLSYFISEEMHFQPVKQKLSGTAHNELLELLADFGLIGLAITLPFFFFPLAGLRHKPTIEPTARIGFLLILMVFFNSLIDFPLQNPSTLLLAVIGMGFVAHATRDFLPRIEIPTPPSMHRALRMVPLLILPLLSYGGLHHYTGETLRTKGKILQQAGHAEEAFKLYNAAHAADPLNRENRLILYPALIGWSEKIGKNPLSPAENDHLFSISANGGQYEPILLLARIQYLINSGRFRERSEEVDRHLSLLAASAPHMPDVQLTIALHALVTGDFAKAGQAISRGRALHGINDHQKAMFQQLENLLARAKSAPGS